MSQINDAKLAFYNTELGTTGALPDQERAWLCQELSIINSGQLNDKWVQYLVSLGYSGQLNDMLFNWLAGMGFSGSLDDKLFSFYSSLSETKTIITRVLTDGGTVEDADFLDWFISYAKDNPYYPFWNDIVAAYSPSWGVKGMTTASKLYSIIGAAQDLEQTTGSKQPVITAGAVNGRTGLAFDGISKMMQGTFAYARPETVILMGFKQMTWTNTDFLFDGKTSTYGGMRQTGVTPEIRQLVEFSSGPLTDELVLNTAGHVRSLYNHPTSNIIQINGNAEISNAVAETEDMAGFTLGARGDDDKFSHITSTTVVLLNSAVDANYAAKMAAILAFSQGAYATP